MTQAPRFIEITGDAGLIYSHRAVPPSGHQNGGTMHHHTKAVLALIPIILLTGCEKTFSWPSDTRCEYTGKVKKGMAHGKGVLTCTPAGVSQPVSFQGEWREGEPLNGDGYYPASSSLELTGSWSNGDFVGKAKQTYASGATYEGDWERGAPHGNGKLEWNDSKKTFVEGKFANGMLIESTNSSDGVGSYVGQFKEGLYHGKGTYNWPDSLTYSGEWLNGKIHGIGIFRYQNEIIREGTWCDGKMEASSCAGAVVSNAMSSPATLVKDLRPLQRVLLPMELPRRVKIKIDPFSEAPAEQKTFQAIMNDARRSLGVTGSSSSRDSLRASGSNSSTFDIVSNREKKLCELLSSDLKVEEWVGRIEAISLVENRGLFANDLFSDNEKALHFSIQLQDGTTLRNSINFLSDSEKFALIYSDHHLFERMNSYRQGDIVRFTGWFSRGKKAAWDGLDWCLEELSISKDSSIREPEYYFKLIAIDDFSTEQPDASYEGWVAEQKTLEDAMREALR